MRRRGGNVQEIPIAQYVDPNDERCHEQHNQHCGDQ
jgi:hypothetical protein